MQNDWYEKLKAFMEGLEINKIDEFMINAKIGDYRKLGEVMSKRIKEIKEPKLCLTNRSENPDSSKAELNEGRPSNLVQSRSRSSAEF